MDVSVVIPALNEEGCIGACLESLTAQAKPHDEILVLDNGSTDETAAIAAAFEPVTVHHLPDDQLEEDGHARGLAALRQRGAELASNPIIATTDADTLPPEGWLDHIRTHFEDDPELSVVWGVVTDTNGVPVRNLTGKFLPLMGGVSGSNTAFRRAHFERLRRGYVGWPVFEDVALITRLARTGKARHDRDLRMVSDLDRRRYQTIPMVAAGAAAIGAGALMGGPAGAIVAGSGVGLAGTELVYEHATTTRFHHDQVGLLGVIGGTALGGPPGGALAGAGAATLGHHALTEGVSGLPTSLMDETDAVCRVPTQKEGETVITELDCSPPEGETDSLTRVLGGVAVGTLAGAGIARLNA